jgi:hypothetical protein
LGIFQIFLNFQSYPFSPDGGGIGRRNKRRMKMVSKEELLKDYLFYKSYNDLWLALRDGQSTYYSDDGVIFVALFFSGNTSVISPHDNLWEGKIEKRPGKSLVLLKGGTDDKPIFRSCKRPDTVQATVGLPVVRDPWFLYCLDEPLSYLCLTWERYKLGNDKIESARFFMGPMKKVERVEIEDLSTTSGQPIFRTAEGREFDGCLIPRWEGLAVVRLNVSENSGDYLVREAPDGLLVTIAPPEIPPIGTADAAMDFKKDNG